MFFDPCSFASVVHRRPVRQSFIAWRFSRLRRSFCAAFFQQSRQPALFNWRQLVDLSQNVFHCNS
jgi:hypothetical protein